MLRRTTSVAVIAAVVLGTFALSEPADARPFFHPGFRGGPGFHGGWGPRGYYGGYRRYGLGWAGWGLGVGAAAVAGAAASGYYGGYYGDYGNDPCWRWWYGRWVWAC